MTDKVNDMDSNRQTKQALREENQRLNHVVDELKLLNALSRAMSSTLEVQEIMAKIISQSVQTIGAEQGTIMLLDKDAKLPLRTIIRGKGEQQRGKIYKLGTHLSGWMIKNHKALLANDISTDKRFRGLEIEKSGIHSILSVPLILRGKLIGVINLFNKADEARFNAEDQKLLSIIATQVASFLANAQSFEQVQESRNRLQQQTIYLKKEAEAHYGFVGIIGESRKIKEIQEEINAIAKSTASVLIYGETGTGKELLARTIHYNSERTENLFVDVNAAAIPDNLLESEFFGIEEGVATGVKKRTGFFEQAHEGTLFIDEIGDMSLSAQAKILRVLEERQVRRVGSNRNLDVNIRLIAATNRNLKEEIDNGTFREDLYYRLSVFEIQLPPLRERKEDLALLMKHFIRKYASRMGKTIEGFSPQAAATLNHYDWPGNIRELANVVERAVILAQSPVISIEYLPPDLKGEVDSVTAAESFEELVNDFKKQIILKSLKESGNNKAEAARSLKISRAYFFRLLNQLGLRENTNG